MQNESAGDLVAWLEAKVAEHTVEWREAFDALPAAVLILDEDRRIQQANTAAVALLKQPPESLRGVPCRQVIPEHLCGPDVLSLSATVHWPEGRWHLVHLNPVAGGRRFLWMAQDITTEKQAQLTALTREQELSILFDLAELLTHRENLQQLLSEALEYLLAKLGSLWGGEVERHGVVFLLDADAGVLRLAVNINAPMELVARESDLPLGQCLCGLAAAKRKVITVSGTRRANKRGYTLCVAETPGAYAQAIIPLFAEKTVEGILHLYFQAGHRFTHQEKQFLRSVGWIMGMAAHNIRLWKELKATAIQDGLTGLYNHKEFQRLLREEVLRARRYHRPLSLFMLDIDNFKKVNDTHGHPQGDLVLMAIGEILRESRRASDITARYGGEEFAVVLPELGWEAARKTAERVRQAVAKRQISLGAETLSVTVSIGVSSMGGEINDADALVRAADQALYAAKAAGRNRVEVASETAAVEEAGSAKAGA